MTPFATSVPRSSVSPCPCFGRTPKLYTKRKRHGMMTPSLRVREVGCRRRLPRLWLLFIATSAYGAAQPGRPNLLAIFADDLGWYDTSLYNPASPTPIIANLARSGLRLDRTPSPVLCESQGDAPDIVACGATGHYVFRYCSPTRRAFLTGRFPNHITTVQPDNTVGGNRYAARAPVG
jgi:hypothetical protein